MAKLEKTQMRPITPPPTPQKSVHFDVPRRRAQSALPHSTFHPFDGPGRREQSASPQRTEATTYDRPTSAQGAGVQQQSWKPQEYPYRTGGSGQGYGPRVPRGDTSWSQPMDRGRLQEQNPVTRPYRSSSQSGAGYYNSPGQQGAGKTFNNCNTIIVTLMVNNVGPFECVLDTGAYGSVIDKNFAQKHGFKIHPLTPDDSTYFTTADNTTVRAEGIVTLEISLGCMVLETDFHVFKNLSADLLVGNEFFQENEVKIDYKQKQRKKEGPQGKRG